jgi:predicted lipid-binding transport protein (Tim44 family)
MGPGREKAMLGSVLIGMICGLVCLTIALMFDVGVLGAVGAYAGGGVLGTIAAAAVPVVRASVRDRRPTGASRDVLDEGSRRQRSRTQRRADPDASRDVRPRERR